MSYPLNKVQQEISQILTKSIIFFFLVMNFTYTTISVSFRQNISASSENVWRDAEEEQGMLL